MSVKIRRTSKVRRGGLYVDGKHIDEGAKELEKVEAEIESKTEVKQHARKTRSHFSKG